MNTPGQVAYETTLGSRPGATTWQAMQQDMQRRALLTDWNGFAQLFITLKRRAGRMGITDTEFGAALDALTAADAAGDFGGTR